MRIEGPVEIAFTTVDPGDYGEPRIFAEDDVTFVTVPTWATIATLRAALEEILDLRTSSSLSKQIARAALATAKEAGG